MQWEEPELALPVPAYTGQPIEESPEATRKRRRRPEEQAEEAALASTEMMLQSKLKTQQTEQVRKESDLRRQNTNDSGVRRSSRRSRLPVNYQERAVSPNSHDPTAPPQLDPKKEEQLPQKKPRLRRNRRSAAVNTVSALRNTVQGRANGTTKQEENGPISNDSQPKQEEPNNDFCSACGGFGDFVCCESCPKSFHLLCVDPPMDEESLPDGAWYCKECTHKQDQNAKNQAQQEEKLTIRLKTEQGYDKDKKEKESSGRKRKSKKKKEEDMADNSATAAKKVVSKQEDSPHEYQKRGLFGELITQIASRNPRVFRLPTSLQNRFEGVLAGEEGEFLNEYELPPKKPRDREENMRLEDKDENPILCFKCSKSAMSGPIISCDKCHLPWHIDCLDPPQFNLPTRWVCPNHVEQAAKIPRRMRNQRVKNTVLRRGHINDGLIEIWDDSNEITKYTPPLIGAVEETPQGFKAKMVNKEREDVIYRLPARSVQLDFIDFVRSQWRDPWRPTQNSQILEVLNELALRPEEEREASRNLAYLKLQGPTTDAVLAKKNMDQLVDVALDNNANDQALAIRSLLQAKGKERLLEFLNES